MRSNQQPCKPAGKPNRQGSLVPRRWKLLRVCRSARTLASFDLRTSARARSLFANAIMACAAPQSLLGRQSARSNGGVRSPYKRMRNAIIHHVESVQMSDCAWISGSATAPGLEEKTDVFNHRPQTQPAPCTLYRNGGPRALPTWLGRAWPPEREGVFKRRGRRLVCSAPTFLDPLQRKGPINRCLRESQLPGIISLEPWRPVTARGARNTTCRSRLPIVFRQRRA